MTREHHALDTLIAAHAVALDVVLVTSRLEDFVGFPGRQRENWLAPESA